MMKNYLVFGLALTLVVFLSGCLSLGPEALAFANPLIKQFMEEYPNAQIQVTYYTAIQSIPILENITSECGKNVSAKEYYVIKIDDPDSGLKVTAWIDWENKRLECAVKYGTGEEKSISKPGEPIKTCKSHAEFKCYGEHVFWFDSCGHKQEKKEYCQEGCELGFCKEKDRKTCEEMGGYCVYPTLTADAGSITGMITGQPIAAQPVCIDSDNGKNYHEKGHVFTGESELWDHCNDDGTLTEKYCTEDGQMAAVKVSCPEGGKCEDGICVGGSGETSEQEEIITDLVCKEGYVKTGYWCPENGICCAPKKTECESHYQYKCYEGHVFWFDSCGNMQEKKYYCEHGCEGSKCIEKVEYECWDSDGGKHYDKEGVVETSDNQRFEDHCNDDGTLTEKYCENNEVKAETVECPAGTICLEGACRGNETACIDSDGGKDYYTKGAITWTPYTTGVQKTDEDVCSNNQEAPLLDIREEGTYLYETYCEDIQYPGAFVVYECPHGCRDGACIENVTCTDSDDGEDYYVKGKLTYGNFTDYDNCLECIEGCELNEDCTGSNCYVNEGFCDPAKDYHGMPLWFDQSYKCPYGCRDGACNKEEAYFEFTDGRDTFIFKLTRPEIIQEARDILAGKITDRVSVMGIIIKQPASYNPSSGPEISIWSYHLHPSTVEFFELAIEECDAGIQYVEDHLDEVCESFLSDCRWCPWGSELTREV